MIFPLNNKNHIIAATDPIVSLKKQNQWLHLWRLEPVILDAYASLSNHQYSDPFYLVLTNEKMVQDYLSGKKPFSNQHIQIIKSKKEQNLMIFNQYMNEVQKLEYPDMEIYSFMKRKIDFEQMDKFIYEYAWN